MHPSSGSPVIGLNLSVPSLVAALKTCTRLKDLNAGRRIHSDIIMNLSDSRGTHTLHIFVANTLIDMYSKCTSMPEARQVFDTLGSSNRTLVTWNALLMGYVINAQPETALSMFSRMQHEGIPPDARTFNAILKALASLDTTNPKTTLQRITEIHAALRETGCESDVFVASTLVRVYALSGDLLQATDVFRRMELHDTVSWTALITGYVQAGESSAALCLFSEMLGDSGSPPDCQTFASVLKACGSLAARENIPDCEKLGYMEKGENIHREIEIRGGFRDMFLESSLVDMYSKCGSMPSARQIFDRMRRKDVIAWNAILMGYAKEGETETTLELFESMSRDVKPDHRTFISVFKACGSHPRIDSDERIRLWCLERGRVIHHRKLLADSGCESVIRVLSTLVDMYGKCRSLEEAREAFDQIMERDVVSWNSIISGCVNCGESELGLLFYWRMIEEDRLVPDEGTFVALLKGVMDLQTGRRIHGDVIRYGAEDHIPVITHLIELYGKCSLGMDRVLRVFESCKTLSLITWNALLCGYSRHGDHREVFKVVGMMDSEGVELTGTSYVCILNSCSHSGMVEMGRRVFEEMIERGRVSVEHYASMVDLLGRVNQLDEALEVIERMEKEGNSSGEERRMVWMTFLSWCEKWRSLCYGREAFRRVLELGGSEKMKNDKDSAPYVLMANTFSEA